MRALERTAGWLSIAAAAIHGGAAPAHFAQWWGYGAFFVAAAAGQAILGLLLATRGIDTPAWPWARVRVPLCLAGIAGNLAIVALWAVTRSVGVPAGPEAGEAEAVGMPDLASKLLEAATIALLARVAWLGRGRASDGPAARVPPAAR